MLKRIKNIFGIRAKDSDLTVSEKIDNLFESLEDDIILLRVGDDIALYGKLICCIVEKLREEMSYECGFILPEVHIKNSSELQENEYRIYVIGNHEGGGFLVPNEDGISVELYECLKTVLYNNISKIFTNELTERYIEKVQKKNGRLIWNVTKVLSVTEIKIILSDIISRGKSINNISYIFERIGDEILLNGGWRDCGKIDNPHAIAQKVAKVLK